MKLMNNLDWTSMFFPSKSELYSYKGFKKEYFIESE